MQNKGQSKITVADVISIRKLKAAEPELSVNQIKERLQVPLSVMALGRTIRGIYHSDVDMCGLPHRPFQHNANIQARIERKQARKAERAAKKAARTADIPVVNLYEVTKTAKGGLVFTDAQVVEIRNLSQLKNMARKDIAAKFNVSLSSVARVLTGKIAAGE